MGPRLCGYKRPRAAIFLPLCGDRGWCAPGIADGIEGPRIFQQEALPVGPSWGDVQRLIASVDNDKPRDIRDRPILMLFAIYAFRNREVAGLSVHDGNWEEEIISIARP